MNQQASRKALRAQYKQTRPESGVYRILNSQNNKALIASATDLASIRSKLEFAKSTSSPSVLDQRLSKDIRQFGLDAFTLEVLDVLDTPPEMTQTDILAHLATLEELWREQLDASLLYR